MTIKKPMKAKPMVLKKSAAGGDEASAAAGGSATGGAAISNRFKLEPIEAPKKTSLSGPAVTAAFIAALVSLGVVGFLTYLMWKHWEFLMPV